MSTDWLCLGKAVVKTPSGSLLNVNIRSANNLDVAVHHALTNKTFKFTPEGKPKSTDLTGYSLHEHSEFDADTLAKFF